MKADHDECAHCSLTRDQHKTAESAGRVNHMFSVDGSLAPVERTPPQAPQGGAPQIIVAPAPDIMLRKMLLELGVITQEQYQRLFGP